MDGSNVGTGTPCDPKSIQIVIDACGCNEADAVDLLTLSKHNTKRAIKRHNLRSKYRGTSPRPSQVLTPSTPQSEAADLAPEPYEDHSSPENFHHPTREPDSFYYRANGSFGNPSQFREDGSSLTPFSELAVSPGSAAEEHGAYEVIDHQMEDAVEETPDWDFVLPVVIPTTTSLGPDPNNEYEAFDLRELVAWMQYGTNLKSIQQYLGRFDKNTVKEHINSDIEGFPAMFYVVESNKEDLLRLWHSYGGDISAVHGASQAPLLAFAIMHSENIQSDTTLMTATLLSLGASPTLIPSAFYSPYLKDLPENGPSNDSLDNLTDEQKYWCKDLARGKLARTCSLSQRYYLERAAKTQKPSLRQQQVAQMKNAEPLLGIANFLIGQTAAAKALLATLLAHIMEPGKKPLVLVFAGPSGHGKTELARRLGQLLSLDLEVVDCTIVNQEMELFGPRHPYVGADKGTPLNNFLAEKHDQRCIVFLDEFEKTSKGIHQTLLLPFENGEYQDRRNLDKINCSKTIWILATNAHDPIIQDFSTTNHRALFTDDDEIEVKRLLKQLSYKLREDFRAHHGAPITGRISEFLPFLTFSVGEQAVIVHKALLELGRKVRQPVNLSAGPEEKLLGNIRLRIRRDASLCRSLAEKEYHADLGARSLNTAAEKIKRLLVEEYLKVDEEITEKGGMSECIIDMSDGEALVTIVPPKVR